MRDSVKRWSRRLARLVGLLRPLADEEPDGKASDNFASAPPAGLSGYCFPALPWVGYSPQPRRGDVLAAAQSLLGSLWKCWAEGRGEAAGDHTRRRVSRAAPPLPGGGIQGADGNNPKDEAVRGFRPSFRRGRRKQHARRVRSPSGSPSLHSPSPLIGSWLENPAPGRSWGILPQEFTSTHGLLPSAFSQLAWLNRRSAPAAATVSKKMKKTPNFSLHGSEICESLSDNGNYRSGL
jgi:hypothetical protein